MCWQRLSRLPLGCQLVLSSPLVMLTVQLREQIALSSRMYQFECVRRAASIRDTACGRACALTRTIRR